MTVRAWEPTPDVALEFDRVPAVELPRVALLDGVPMANHVALTGRLIIDDPDEHTARYETAQRGHGSGMASLILHGDLSSPEDVLPQQIYVRPIFEPHSFFPRVEIVPKNQLLVDLIHRAFHRIFEGDGTGEAAAPSVRVVCLALGDPARVFIRRLSPLARLLDWLAEKYNIVIVVSGGNVDDQPMIDVAALTGSDERQRQASALRSLHERASHRRLLAPAEAVNVLTVGAIHTDGLELELPGTVLDIVPNGLPATYSPVGFGYRRSVKPEVFLPGGRQVFSTPPPSATGRTTLEALESPAVGPGLRVATPGLNGETGAVSYTCGTSNSAALATRILSQIFDILEGLRAEDDQFPFPDAQFHPVLAKTLLVHSAGWHDERDRLSELLGLSGREVRRELTRILGYGVVRSARAISAESTRVVLLGSGLIEKDQRHTFRFPLPSVLSASTEWRRLTITLGWLSPVNVQSQKYRIARLWFTSSKDDIGVGPTEADHHAVFKGTIQHQVFEGTAATAYADEAALTIDVDCRSDGGTLRSPVRYGLAASLEVGPAVRADIYNQTRSRLSDQVRQRTLVPVR